MASASPVLEAYESDSDSSPRVYFGPLQSPEKKLIPELAHRPTPVRRSLRPAAFLTLSPLPSNSAYAEDEEGSASAHEDDGGLAVEPIEVRSRSGTPSRNDVFQDEPPSALAERVMHAHDNPSPPPRRLDLLDDTTETPVEEVTELAFANLSSSPQTPIILCPAPRKHELTTTELANAQIPTGHLSSDLRVLPAPVLAESPSLPSDSNALTPDASHEPDLISFEPMLAPATPTYTNLLTSRELHTNENPPTLDKRSSTAIVDDSLLNSLDPILVSGVLRDEVAMLGHPSDNETLSDMDVAAVEGPCPADAQVMRPGEILGSDVHRLTQPSLSREDDGVREVSGSPCSEAPGREEASIDVNEQRTLRVEKAVAPVSKEVLLQTPLRRSSRKSLAPSPPPVVLTARVAAASPSRLATLFTEQLDEHVESPVTPQRPKKKWKGKERANSPFDGDEKNVFFEDPLVPAYEGDDLRVRRKSLSPTRISIPEDQINVKKERRRRQERDGSKGPDERRRPLRSLSPDSIDVLCQLLPSSSMLPLDKEPTPDPSFADMAPAKPSTSSLLDSAPLPEVTTNLTPSLRASSPAQNAQCLPSPIKHPVGAFLRTPARRIPIEQAIAQGTRSPAMRLQLGVRQTDAATGVRHTPIVSRAALDDPNRSPAKRVPISEAMAALRTPTRSGPLAKFPPTPRGGFMNPKQPAIGTNTPKKPIPITAEGMGHSFSFPKAPKSAPAPSQLPFPIVLNSASDTGKVELTGELSTMAGAVSEAGHKVRPLPSKTQPVSQKSSLRQPSSASRIPRIGAKPYGRPSPASRSIPDNKLPAVPRKATGLGSNSGTMKVARTTSIGESSSDDSSSRTTLLPKPVSPKLKRKREPEIAPSPPPRHTTSTSTSSRLVRESSQLSAGTSNSPTKVQRPFVARKVVDGMFAKRFEQVAEGSDCNSEAQESRTEETSHHPEIPQVHMSRNEDPESNFRSASKENTPPSSPVLFDPLSISDARSVERSAIQSSPEPEDGPPVKVRRMTRARKQAPPSNVFGTLAAKPLQSRRKPPSSRSEPLFAGMSAVALRALTNSNTSRNQQYLTALLETEVIRKDGDRPESPPMKMKTVSQKSDEDKGKERRERAQRRARRSEEGSSTLSDGESQGNDSIAHVSQNLHSDDASPKYRRGPGDDEDYETPERLRKKAETEGEERKRVKWDRGLFTTIYIDEIELDPKKAYLGEPASRKGCLAKAAKALCLDSLGNLSNTDGPLTDLVQENIIVKKFVYDNDVEAEPSTPSVKVTRSKSKKSKT